MTAQATTLRPAPGLAGARPQLVVAVVSVANFLVMADATIVNVALPSIGRAFGLPALGLPWLVNSYSFAFGGCLLLGGYAAGLLGPRRAFAAGMLLFGAGSLGCGLSGPVAMLLAGRVVQGLGGALACPAALSLITVTFPAPAGRLRALAGWSAAGAAAVALGPMIGGLLTGLLRWPSVFLVPAPVCVAAAAAGLRWLPRPAGRPGPGRAPRAACFPLRRTAAADLVLALTSGAMVAACYACTLWTQDILHFGPVQAGAALLPLSAGIVAGAALAPRLIRRAGLRRVAIGGLAVAVAAAALLSRTPARAGLAELLPLLTLLAAGFGVQSVPISFVATAVPGREALASALYQTAGQLGGGGGLLLLAALAAAGTAGAHGPAGAALAAGYDLMFAGGAGALTVAGLVAALLRPPDAPAQPGTRYGASR